MEMDNYILPFSRYTNILQLNKDNKQSQLDQIIVNITEKYIELPISENELISKEIIEFIEFGIKLIKTDIKSRLVEMILQNEYETIAQCVSEDILTDIRFQLLFIKEAIKLLGSKEYDDYFSLIEQLSSQYVNTAQYRNAFKQKE